MIVLLSPAKSLDYSTPYPIQFEPTQVRFQEQTTKLVNNLKRKSAKGIKELMSISDDLAQLNKTRYMDFKLESSTTKAALYAFNGEVYNGLDAYQLKENQLEFAQRHLRILSGLYGVLRPMDAIAPYRLEMGTRLKIGKHKNLYQFWGDQLVDSLKREITEHKDQTFINLASLEYFKAVRQLSSSNKVITPVFKDFKNGKLKVIQFFAKKARGQMTRFIIDQELKSPEHVKLFNAEGYTFSEAESSEVEWVFTR